MNRKSYKKIRVAVILFIALIVMISVEMESFVLATVAVLTGMIFMTFVRSRAKIKTDEREIAIREKAANITYAIFAPTIGISAFLMLFPVYSGLSVFSKGEFVYLESLGMVFAYLTLFIIVLYAISYLFLNKKYGGNGNEE